MVPISRRHFYRIVKQSFYKLACINKENEMHLWVASLAKGNEVRKSDLSVCINSLRPRPNRRHFTDDIFKFIFENENEWIPPRISMKFVPKVQVNHIPALVQIMAWRRPDDKPLSEPMLASLPTHISVTRPEWVKSYAGRWNSHQSCSKCVKVILQRPFLSMLSVAKRRHILKCKMGHMMTPTFPILNQKQSIRAS